MQLYTTKRVQSIYKDWCILHQLSISSINMLFFPMINGGTKRAKGRLLCLCMHLEHDVSITIRTLWTKAAMQCGYWMVSVAWRLGRRAVWEWERGMGTGNELPKYWARTKNDWAMNRSISSSVPLLLLHHCFFPTEAVKGKTRCI